MRPFVIGQDALDRIRRDTDLVALIGESVKLKKMGRSYVGLCPFHQEKSPSFHVNPERGFYHCFGCHVSGDAIRFVQESEGLPFIDAVRRLAERCGFELAEDTSPEERRRQTETRRRSEELYEASEAAAVFFERMLREHPLRAYAEAELERRALVPKSPTDPIADALQAFRIGYAPYGWESLARHLREHKLSLSAAERVGLVAPRKAGQSYYDRFRHRLMFAVSDVQGRIIAFSGRSLDEPSREELESENLEPPAAGSSPPAKYYNSPESPIYRKREALFGLHQSRQAIRASDQCVLVEGNFDVVSLHAQGKKNVVAPLGTAFTAEQARQIRRFCPEVILLFDGDDAGRRAVRAARDVCRSAGLAAKVGTLGEGLDPDAVIRSGGVPAIDRAVAAAQPLLAYLVEALLNESFHAADAAGRAARVTKVIELLASEEDPTVRALAESHADAIAARLGISDVRTLSALRRAVHRGLGAGTSPAQAPAPRERARSRDRRLEIGLEILGTFLDFPELWESPDGAEAASLLEGETATAFAALRQADLAKETVPSEVSLAKLSPPIHAFALARLAAPRHARVEDARAELSGNVRQLKALVLSREKRTVAEELERTQRTGDFDQEMALLSALYRKARQNKLLASD